MGRQVFTAGEILTAANMNDLGDATVMVFDDATARTTAIPTPVEGMVTYLKDTDEVDKFDGSDFVPVGIAPAILQVVETETNTITTNSTATFVNTASTATITPTSATSKIIILASGSSFRSSDAGAEFFLALFRGGVSGTQVTSAISAIFFNNSSNQFVVPWSLKAVDSPATTSPVTYTVGISRGNIATTVNAQASQPMILMEVAG